MRLPVGVALLALAWAAWPSTAAAARAPETLLLHRVAALQSQTPAGAFYVGTDTSGRLHFRSRAWTRGFFAGALWQASSLAPEPNRFERWALARTRATFGYEGADSHDLGFVYETSSVAGYRRLCRGGRSRPRICRSLRASGLRAARRLLGLAATNPGPGTVPTRKSSPSRTESQTIVDSTMNMPLLYWASRETGDPRFSVVAARHVRRVAEQLVRSDGSTIQAVHQDRRTGQVLKKHTHQGLSTDSTWSRGQGWAVYGFAASAAALNDAALLAVAERGAGWVDDHLPSDGVPLWDYNAAAQPASDTSAGAITAAGLYRLVLACRRLRCREPERWRRLADRMLAAVLERVSRRPPLGYLGGSAGSYGRGPSWDDDAELVYGLYYTLEALYLRRRMRP